MHDLLKDGASLLKGMEKYNSAPLMVYTMDKDKWLE